MEKIARLKAIPLEELIPLILESTPGAVDSIISFLNLPKTGTVEVQSLHGFLKKESPSTQTLLKAMNHSPTLSSLNQDDLRLFYYGCAQGVLELATIRGIYYDLQNASSVELSDEIRLKIFYLYKAGNLKTDIGDFTTNVLRAFGISDTWRKFGNLVRPLMFQFGNESAQGRYDGVGMLCQKLKAGKSVQQVTPCLLGICVQTKWFSGIPLTQQFVERSLKDLEEIMVEIQQLKDGEFKFMRITAMKRIGELVKNYRHTD